jgi:hypothetical protein
MTVVVVVSDGGESDGRRSNGSSGRSGLAGVRHVEGDGGGITFITVARALRGDDRH